MKNRVRTEISHRIARVTLDRPDKHNALDRGMFEGLVEAGESLLRAGGSAAVRAVVLSGAGENFCAGIDVSVFGGDGPPAFAPRDLEPRAGSAANLFQSAALVWRRLPVPVIAAVHGAAFGAGLQIALGADIRFATAASRWSVMEVCWGIIPDMGISLTARGLVAPDRLKKLAFTGGIVDGTGARQLGLVTELHDRPLDAALDLARELAGRSPDALRAVKTLVDEAWGDRADELLRREAALQASLLGSPNQLEAVAARIAGREPEFVDPDA